jgi:hypothetical protein
MIGNLTKGRRELSDDDGNDTNENRINDGSKPQNRTKLAQDHQSESKQEEDDQENDDRDTEVEKRPKVAPADDENGNQNEGDDVSDWQIDNDDRETEAKKRPKVAAADDENSSQNEDDEAMDRQVDDDDRETE